MSSTGSDRYAANCILPRQRITTVKQQRHHPDKRSARAQRDDWLKKEIQRVYDENHKVYGVRKVWRQLLREGIRVARCTVARLMAVMGLAGVLRGKRSVRPSAGKPLPQDDRVNRQFVAERPDSCGWLILLTSAHGGALSMWRSFIDVFAGYIVGWRSHRPWKRHSCWMHWSMALWARRPSGTVHHRIRVLSMYRWPTHSGLRQAGRLLASTGSTGDSYDNAMAESINGLYTAEVIPTVRAWKNRAEVELATLTWVDWYNNRTIAGKAGPYSSGRSRKTLIMLPSIGNDDLFFLVFFFLFLQPEFTDKTLSRKPGAVSNCLFGTCFV